MMENFPRKLEEANEAKRDKIVKKIGESVVCTAAFFCLEFCSFTTILPLLHVWPEEFRGLIDRSLVDQDMKSDLEEGKLINWCRTAQLLYPLKTTKDGNCLLHSISVYIWGVEDHSLFLRRLLFCTLQSDERKVFKQRYFQFISNRNSEVYGDLLHFNSMDRDVEWKDIVDCVEPKHTPSFAQPLSFLEPIHIYVMANIIRRPIIVMADSRIRTVENVSIQDNDIVGIYLPLDIEPGQCYKYPVVLGFSYNHFTPLVTTKEDPRSPRKLSIPLQKHDWTMLPVRFLNSAEERQILTLMPKYLNLIDLVHSEPISAAKLGDKTLPDDLNLIQDYFRDGERKYRRFINGGSHPGVFGNIQQNPIDGQQNQHPVKTREDRNVSPPTMSHFQTVQCITKGCSMYGSASTGNMCSDCLKKYTIEQSGPPKSLFFKETEPTAPPPSRPLNSMSNVMSMVEQKCQTPDCKFMCSLTTFPLCHECKEKKEKQGPKLSVNVNRQPSNQSEEMTKLSAKLDTNVENGIRLTPQTPAVTKQTSAMNSDLSESELFGTGNGCRGEVLVPSLTRFNSQTHLVSNTRKEAEVIPNRISPRPVSPPTEVKPSCLNSGCHGTSISSNGLCSMCYMQIGHLGSQQTSNRNPTLQHSTNQSATGVTSTPKSVDRFVPKQLCAKSGCHGFSHDNKFGMCSKCFEALSTEKKKDSVPVVHGATGLQELNINRHGSIEDNLEVSESPSDANIEPRQVSCMDDDSTECASPLCDALVYPPNKLCQNCLDVLRQHQPSPKKQPKQDKQTTQQCRKAGCEFHGSEEFQGFCSRCYRNLQVGDQYVVTNNNSAPIKRQDCYPIETPQPRSNSAPITRKGAKCTIEGCSYFGDPVFSNMCTTCYHIFNPKSADTTGGEKYPVQEASLSQGASNLVSNFNSFDRSAQLLEQSRKEKSLCRRYGCKNHGNSNCEGFCNNCFRKYYPSVCRNNLEQIG